MTEKPLHILLLLELEKEGIGRYVNVSKFILKHFEKPINQDDWISNAGAPYKFVNILAYRNLLDIKPEQVLVIRFGDIVNPPAWYDSQEWLVCMTVDGVDYLDSYRLSELNKELIISNKLTNKITRRNFYATLGFSVATLIFIALNYLISKRAFELNFKKAKSDSLSSIQTSKLLDTLQLRLYQMQEASKKKTSIQTFRQQKHPLRPPSVSGN